MLMPSIFGENLFDEFFGDWIVRCGEWIVSCTVKTLPAR